MAKEIALANRPILKEFPPLIQIGIGEDGRAPVNILEESIYLLENLGYKTLSTETKEQEIGLVRGIENGNYPRFHIILEQSTFEIASFHIDELQHKILPNSFSKKDEELKRLIKELEKEKKDAARNKLLYLLRSEQLVGNIREEGLIGKTQDERWDGLLTAEKKYRLTKEAKYAWEKKKEKSNAEDSVRNFYAGE